MNTSSERHFVDQISELPDPIIHHILSFLCAKDACRTSILSKKWTNMWRSFPILDFDQRNFLKQVENHDLSDDQNLHMTGKNFQNIVDRYLLSRCLLNVSIQKFKLYLTSHEPGLDHCMNIWISSAAECNVAELDLQIKRMSYDICPEAMLMAKTVTVLRLHGCKLHNLCSIKLPLLQRLNLGKSRVDQQMFKKFISSCPLIKDLRLVSCTGLKHMQVSNLDKLNRVELYRCRDLRRVVINAPNLQTFWYHGKKNVACDINLSSCRILKCLTLDHVQMDDEGLVNHLSNFPRLEKMLLSRCENLKNVAVSGEMLGGLSLRSCKNLEEARICAPKLVSFDYEGDIIPFNLIGLSTLQDAKLLFRPILMDHHDKNISQWNAKLINFLERFGHSSGLKLVAHFNQKNVTIYEELQEMAIPLISDLKAEISRLGTSSEVVIDNELRVATLPPVSILEVEIIKSSTSFEEVLYDVLQSCRPKRLSLIASSLDKVSKFKHGVLDAASRDLGCCRFYANNKCWRHYLEEADIMNGAQGDGGEWIVWPNPSRPRPEAFNFELKWKLQSSVR